MLITWYKWESFFLIVMEGGMCIYYILEFLFFETFERFFESLCKKKTSLLAIINYFIDNKFFM